MADDCPPHSKAEKSWTENGKSLVAIVCTKCGNTFDAYEVPTPTPVPAASERMTAEVDLWVKNLEAAGGNQGSFSEDERTRFRALADLLTRLSARAEAAEARAERARAALEKIEGMSVPDQPAAFALSRETYLMRWVAKLRGVARDALLTAPPPTAGGEG